MDKTKKSDKNNQRVPEKVTVATKEDKPAVFEGGRCRQTCGVTILNSQRKRVFEV